MYHGHFCVQWFAVRGSGSFFVFNGLQLEVVVRFCVQWFAVRGSSFLCSMVCG